MANDMSIADADKFDALIERTGVRLSYPRKALIYCEKDPVRRTSRAEGRQERRTGRHERGRERRTGRHER